jgi:hypothetical protein
MTIVGVALRAAALVVLKHARHGTRQEASAFDVLGTDASSAAQRIAAPPVDLSWPLNSEAQWRTIRAHADDRAYRAAVETVRLRYRIVSNPMLLPNTIRETMTRHSLTFREAMICVAEDDGLRH